MAYYIGRDTPVTLVGLSGQKVTAYDPGNKANIACTPGVAEQYPMVRKDRKLAFLHFTLIADILSHLTKGTSENDTRIRRRRVAEANLIYSMVGLPTVTYGDPVGKYPRELTGQSLAARGLVDLMTSTLYAFRNEASNLVSGADVKVIYQNKQIDPDGSILQDRSRKVLQYAGALSGVKVMPISSLYRPPEKQGATMAENWHSGNRIHYGPAGTAVNNVYVEDARKNPGQKPGFVSDERFRAYTKQKMVEKCKELCSANQVVSRHCWDYTRVQAMDISSKQLVQQFKYSAARTAVQVFRGHYPQAGQRLPAAQGTRNPQAVYRSRRTGFPGGQDRRAGFPHRGVDVRRGLRDCPPPRRRESGIALPDRRRPGLHNDQPELRERPGAGRRLREGRGGPGKGSIACRNSTGTRNSSSTTGSTGTS